MGAIRKAPETAKECTQHLIQQARGFPEEFFKRLTRLRLCLRKTHLAKVCRVTWKGRDILLEGFTGFN